MIAQYKLLSLLQDLTVCIAALGKHLNAYSDPKCPKMPNIELVESEYKLSFKHEHLFYLHLGYTCRVNIHCHFNCPD